MSLANDLSSPPSTGSPASIDSMPETPVSPSAPTQTLGLPVSEAAPTATASGSASNTAAANKRKPSRRANTAERRATHNAVERQRRETLNSRFLDLAALLPNLSQIRRPSKSAIVNSSIAHIHSSRRHRAMAARELRLLKLESDALRRELNEWRDRAGLPRVEEPARSDGFGLVMSGEVEIIPIVPGLDDEEDGDEDDYPSAGPGAGPVPSSTSAVSPVDDEAYLAQAYAQAQMRRQGPMIVSTVPSVAFENPALPPSLYDAHPPHIPTGFQQQQQLQQQYLFDDKHAWSSQLLAAQQQMQLQQQHQVQQQQQQHHNQHNQHQHNQHHNQMQQGGFPSPTSPYGTPPSSGYGTPPGSAYGASPSGGFAGMTTTSGAGGLFGNAGRPSLYGSPVEDGDASSVSSGRTRSGSLNGFEDAAAHMFQKRMSGAGFAGGAANFQLMM